MVNLSLLKVKKRKIRMKKLNWKKIIGWGIVVLGLGFVIYFNMKDQKSLQNSKKRNVYVVLQLTGPIAEAGKHVKTAMDSWIEMHPHASFNLIYVDSESMPNKAVTGIQQKTLNDDHPITITAGSIFSNVILPVMEERDGFNFSIISLNSVVDGYTNAQNLSYSTEGLMQPIVDEINKRYKSVAVISSFDENGEQQKNYLVEHVHPQIKVFKLSLFPNQQDIRLEIIKLLRNKPEVVVILMTPTLVYQNVLKELRSNFSGTVLTDIVFENKFLNEVVSNSNLKVYTLVDKNISNNQKLKEFEKKLLNNNSYLFFVTKQSYDALDIIDYFIKNDLPFEQDTFAQIGYWAGMSNITFSGKGESSIKYDLVPFKNKQFIPVESEEKEN